MGETAEERTRRLMRAMTGWSDVGAADSYLIDYIIILENHIADSTYNKDLIKFNKFIFKFT